jgi:hypothetical protein
MSGFKDIAASAKATVEKEVAERTRKYNEERQARDTVIQAGVELLNKEVMPALLDAKREFATENLDVKVEQIKEYDRAVLKFQLISRPRRGDGYRLEGCPAFFVSDGKSITVGMGERSYDKQPKTTLGSFTDSARLSLIKQAVQEAAIRYLREWERFETGW